MNADQRAELNQAKAVFQPEPSFKTQEDEFGNAEKVDVSKFNHQIMCGETGCMRVRFIKAQDVAQTKYCKPCTRKRRLASRAARARTRRASKDNVKKTSTDRV